MLPAKPSVHLFSVNLMLSERTTLNGTKAYCKQSALAIIIPSSDKLSTYPEVCLAVVGNCWLVLPTPLAPWATPTEQSKTISGLTWKNVHFSEVKTSVGNKNSNTLQL